MPRPKSDIPSYRKHSSGQARTTINGRDYLLGLHGTQASKREYDRLIAEYLASGRSPCFGIADDLAMTELMLAYLSHAKRYFGTGLSSEWHRIKLALRPVTALYSKYPAVQFGPQEFKAVRQQMIDNGLTRTGINANMKRVVRMFKWAAAEAMQPAGVYETLRLIPSLRKGRSQAKETEPVKPVSREVVEATLKHLTPVLADMVRTQLYLGCRPGEVCRLSPGMIDRREGSDGWKATLGEHNTAHHGHRRLIFLGPNVQSVIRPYLLRGPDDCLFRPMDSSQARRERDHAKRTVPLSCGNRPGKSNRPKSGGKSRTPGDRYSVAVYARAITRAAKKAGVEHWSPNQLRHTRATEIRTLFGLEGAQVTLGHASADVTQVYAERNEKLAMEIARKTG